LNPHCAARESSRHRRNRLHSGHAIFQPSHIAGWASVGVGARRRDAVF
jgi:hypothetical protein